MSASVFCCGLQLASVSLASSFISQVSVDGGRLVFFRATAAEAATARRNSSSVMSTSRSRKARNSNFKSSHWFVGMVQL